MQYKCDKCDKYFTSKKKKTDHERRVHTATEQPGAPATEQPGTPATLQVKPPPQKTKEKAATGFHCVDCGASVTKGQDRCSSCGCHLDWSQVNE